MFVLIGLLGLFLLLAALLFDDVLDGLVPDSDWLSLTAIAVFLAAFGLVGWSLDRATSLPALVSAFGGAGVGIALAAVAVRWSRQLTGMSTDATPAASDLVGCQGRVVTAIVDGSAGEALVRLGG
ncbi:MAG: hypothetical protein ACR2QK_06790, partial [Acidimicrobiales bacterium]